MKAKDILAGTAALMLLGTVFVAGCGQREGNMAPAASTAPAAGQGEIAQKFCPVMGGPVNSDIYVDYQGRRVYFCCTACVDAFKQDPAKYLKKLDEAEQKEGSSGSHQGQ